MIRREEHRFHAFVKFEKVEGLFQSVITPDYNIIPLLGPFFEKRYADQRWLIFDKKRHYGIYYDKEKVAEMELDFEDGSLSDSIEIPINDTFYKDLWRTYFDSGISKKGKISDFI
jgi:probable DNA metabolism protein